MSKAEVTLKVSPTDFERIIEGLRDREATMIARRQDQSLTRLERDTANREHTRTKALREELMLG